MYIFIGIQRLENWPWEKYSEVRQYTLRWLLWGRFKLDRGSSYRGWKLFDIDAGFFRMPWDLYPAQFFKSYSYFFRKYMFYQIFRIFFHEFLFHHTLSTKKSLDLFFYCYWKLNLNKHCLKECIDFISSSIIFYFRWRSREDYYSVCGNLWIWIRWDKRLFTRYNKQRQEKMNKLFFVHLCFNRFSA